MTSATKVEISEEPWIAEAARGFTRTPWALGVALCALLAVAQIVWSGYQLGVGNQAIQVAFLRHAADPGLFAGDEMVQTTEATYATSFFRMLAPLLAVSDLEPLYLMLHILTTFATLVSAYVLARTITHSHFTAITTVLVLTAGHHRALAGDTLYSTGFTHTYAVFGPALLALALFYARRTLWAFALAGLLLNIHALTAGYVLAMMTAALLADWGEERWTRTARRGVMGLLIAAGCGLPTLVMMFAVRQVFDGEWMNLMRVRSGDHSFASTWWVVGDPTIPRFVVMLALFVLSWSFRVTSRTMRITRWMTLAVLGLFAAGYLFTDIYPNAWMVRLQPFRASRLLMILMFIHIVHAATQAIRMLPRRELLAWAPRVLELLSGVMVLGAIGEPSLLPALPLALVVVTGVALVTGRLSWWQGVIGTGALVVVVAAHVKIQFPLPVISPEVSLWPQLWLTDRTLWLALGTAGVAALGWRFVKARALKLVVIGGCVIIAGAGFWELFQRQFAEEAGTGLIAAQRWMERSTPKDAVIMAPSNVANLRIYAVRSMVSNWRDGTQLYFSAEFGKKWWEALSAIEPEIVMSPDGSRLIARGLSLASLDDDRLIEAAKRGKATHLLLPTPKDEGSRRALEMVYSNQDWTVYLPRISQAGLLSSMPPGGNASVWVKAERFYQTTVQENIEKNRKAEVAIQVVDMEGRPVQDLVMALEQKRHAFLFGASLSFFEPNTKSSLGDQKPPPVTARELELFPQLFTASMIPFSGKWMYTEPTDGERDYSDLDQYVEYANERGIALEFHYLAGLTPQFLRRNPAEHARRYPDHARELMARYQGRIAFWQVTNANVLIDQAPELFEEFWRNYPGVKLGISECTRFYSDKIGKGRYGEMFSGLDTLRALKQKGVTPDFFSMHGHYPVGCWTDPRDMYEVLDAFAKEGVRVHVSELLLPLGTDIVGGLMKARARNEKGTPWTEDLRGEFLERYLSVCFSHPSVEMVNLWGLPAQGWGGSAGLLDADMNPRKTFYALQDLWNKKWHTSVARPLGLDGMLRTRAFHGEYEVSLKLMDGREVKAPLKVPEAKMRSVRFQLDAAKGVLEEMP